MVWKDQKLFHADLKDCKTVVNPSLNIRYTISSKWEISGDVRHNNDFGSQTQLYTGYILTGYNNLDHSIARRVSEGYAQSANLYLKFKNPLKSRFANISGSYSQSHNNYLYRIGYDSLGLAYSEMLELNNRRRSMNFNASLSQYFRTIKTVLKLSGFLVSGKSDRLINDAFVKFYSTPYGASGEVINSSSNWISAEYRYNLSIAGSHYTGKPINTSTIQNHALDITIFPLPRHTLSVYTRYYISRLYTQTDQLFMNLKYTFTMPKTKTDLSVTCNNIFNAQHFIRQYNSAYMLSYSELYLRPRQLVASVRFNFK
ncbi:hypothetical protein [Niabella aurantiaca]|uniref:hypothetical protein n=1 Tax=Niabella aurantiaca TaxID=379900 RepID=UPI0003A6526A|nr:hypothetical protein [Niabella aurantiaca]